MFSGDRVIVFGFLADKIKGETKVSLHAKMGANEVVQTVTLSPNALEKGEFYHKLAARELIQ